MKCSLQNLFFQCKITTPLLTVIYNEADSHQVRQLKDYQHSRILSSRFFVSAFEDLTLNMSNGQLGFLGMN